MQSAALLLTLPFPNIDPVAFWIGPLPIRWYGLAYAAGLLIGWQYIRSLVRNTGLWNGKPPLTVEAIDSLLLWIVGGVVIGGRLGSVLLYEPEMIWQNPIGIVQTWNGGMAFHGGVIGVIIALLLFGRRHAVSPVAAGDLVAAALPIGLFLGRIANFINGELWGRASTMPWAMVFPHPEAGGIARHPSQLYEALLEGLVLFLVLRYFMHSARKLNQPGFIAGSFLVGYAAARIFCEIFRDGDTTWLDPSGTLTLGILYSLPMLIGGAYLLRRGRT